MGAGDPGQSTSAIAVPDSLSAAGVGLEVEVDTGIVEQIADPSCPVQEIARALLIDALLDRA